MEPHAALAGDWVLWRDFAVRSAGFPVEGLGAFGPGDEPARLREVARDERFREAVTWQNPAALEHAVLNVASGAPAKPSRTRQREEIVASYWQRYCGKNDTIGFFGPLAWGRVDDDAPRVAVRSGAVVRQRAVHLETWGVQALAETIDPELRIAAGPHPERDMRDRLDGRGSDALDRLEAARDAITAAPPGELRSALAHLDATFVELTGREPVRNPGRAYGARTLAYADCMRDLDVAVGPALVAEVAPALHTLFEATRWYCGEVNAIGARIVEHALPAGGRGPFGPVLGEVLRTVMTEPPEVEAALAEVHRRLEALLADPDPTTIGARAAAAFADHRPGWRTAVFQSVDLQIAARDAAALADGDYLAVIGDVHPGACPLVQGVFAHRHPDPDALLRRLSDGVGDRMSWLLPPWAPGIGVDARGAPVTPLDDIHIAAMPDARAQGARRTWLANELLVDGGDLVDRDGELRVALLDVFALPIFISGVRVFELLPEVEHAPRITVGRTVIRREGWSVPAADLPRDAAGIPAFARERGMPRRLFAKSPLERKPMYLDAESPVLARILCRHARRAEQERPGARIAFTEMLPAPDRCWLGDPDGRHYVSELRMVAVDTTCRSGGRSFVS